MCRKSCGPSASSGFPHERIDAGGPFGGLDTDEFRAMNPDRRVPVIDDDGTIVWESHADRALSRGEIWHGLAMAGRMPARARIATSGWIGCWPICSRLSSACSGISIARRKRNANWPVDPPGHRALRRSSFACSTSIWTDKAFIAGDMLTIGDIPAGAQLYPLFRAGDRPRRHSQCGGVVCAPSGHARPIGNMSWCPFEELMAARIDLSERRTDR